MSAFRTTVRWLMWTAIVVVAVPIVLYLFAFVVNWRDQPPNAEALELAATAVPEPIADATNAYVYVLGFAVPRVGDPGLVGTSRAQWIRSMAADAEIDPASDPYPGSAPDFQEFPERLAEVLTPCGGVDAACVAALEGAVTDLGERLDEQRLLIERYRTLLGYRAWQDVTSHDLRNPQPPYSEIGHARRLFMLDTWRLAAAGDANEVRARLDADIRFWRMALAESDWLFGKTIAASYVNLNFLWGNLILRRLPPERRADGMPEGWRKAVTNAERSVRRALVNEWRVADSSIRSIDRTGLARPPPAGKDSRSAIDRVLTPLALQLLQPQATLNRYASAYVKVDALLNAPYAELASKLPDAASLDERPRGVLGITYNLFGHTLGGPDPSYLANAGARFADLEGARRAVVLTVDLRVLKMPPELAGAMIPLSAVRDPYTGGPFTWNAEPPTVSFTGLERTSNTRHRFLY